MEPPQKGLHFVHLQMKEEKEEIKQIVQGWLDPSG